MSETRCSKCKELKPADGFRKRHAALQQPCKACMSEYEKQWRKARPPAVVTVVPEAKPCITCKEVKPIDAFHRNKGNADGRQRQCNACMRAYGKQWRLTAENRKRVQVSCDKWRLAQPKERLAAIRKRRYDRRKSEAEFILRMRVTRRLKRACIDRRITDTALFEKLGYTLNELVVHLEKQFLDGMTWSNWGKWHIDHIIPLVSFKIDSMDSPDFLRAWALSNLRPLWAKDNLSKGSKRLYLL